jgi:acetyl-CoA acetyltransferase
MTNTFPARNQVAVVGCAQSPVQRHSEQPLGVVAVETARAAISDAGLAPAQIDGFATSALFPTAGDHAVVDGVSTVSANWLAERLGINPMFASGFQGYGQLPGAVALAVNALMTGAATHVLVHRALHNPAGTYHGAALQAATGPSQWTVPQGYFGPLAMIAMPANEYMQRFGAGRDALGAVVGEARKNGARIPWSYWYERPLAADDYLAAPLIADPICRLDCDIPVDGVAAFVLTTAERALDLPNSPVFVSGFASGHPVRPRLPLHWPLDDILDIGREMARRLWTRSGVGPGEVDLPQVYDGFSPFVWFWLEVLGFSPPGEAHRFVTDGGIDSDSPGGLPALSGGGALGNGRMHGVPQMLECYLQLSGRAGNRQRADSTIGVACHSSPHYGGAVVYSATAF